MSNKTFFEDLNIIEEDSKHMESIDRLQKAFREVRHGYRQEYDDSMRHVLDNVKEKIKKNHGMVEAVKLYVQEYSTQEKRHDATEALYDLLAAEMLHTLQTLQHTSCCVM